MQLRRNYCAGGGGKTARLRPNSTHSPRFEEGFEFGGRFAAETGDLGDLFHADQTHPLD
jgi:hypothetical protein